MDDSDQKGANEEEWNNSNNWSGGILGIYFSKKDDRLWVPKRADQGLGWTLNMAHRAGPWLAICILLLPLSLTLIMIFVLVG